MTNCRLFTSLSYASSYGSTFEDFVVAAGRKGFTAVQLIPDQTPNLYSDFSRSRAEELGRIVAELGIEVSVHNVFYDINLLSVVPDVRNAAFDVTRKVLEFASSLGSRRLTVHPGYMFGGWRRDPLQARHFWEEASNSLRRLNELAVDYSFDISMENGSYYVCTAFGEGRTPLHLGITPVEIGQLLALGGRNLSLCLDVNKALRSGHAIEDFLEVASGRISQVQISTAGKYLDAVRTVLTSLCRGDRDIEVVLEGSPSEASEASEIVRRLISELSPRPSP